MPFIPAIGSSFDALAGQGQYYAGLNANILRGNVDAQQQAANERNQYLLSVAQMQREAAAQNAAAQQRAVENAIAQYQFNSQMSANQRRYDQQAGLKQEQLDLGVQADKDQQALRTSQKNDSDALQGAYDMAGRGGFGSRQDVLAALPNATKLQIDDIWNMNSNATQQKSDSTAQTNRVYQFSKPIADQLNLRQVLGSTLSKGAPSTVGSVSPTPWYGGPVQAGQALRSKLGFSNVDTSWFDSLKSRAGAIDDQLSKLGIKYDDATGQVMTPPKTSLNDFGIVFNPGTGKYVPVSPAAGGSGASPTFTATAAPPSAPNIPLAAVTYLKQHPELANDFDQKYGQGKAASILGG